MLGCVLRVASDQFQVDEFLKTSTFTPCDTYRKGEPRGQTGKFYDESGITVVVSDASGDELSQQVEDTIEFLEQNKVEINRLRGYVEPEAIVLDFGVWNKDVFGQYCHFPAKLIEKAGPLGIALELSFYRKDED